jgi:arylsulfatase A-like enzyme
MRCPLSLPLIAALVFGRSLQAAPPPNILFIAVDDLKPVLGHLSEEPNNFLSEVYPDPAKRAEIRRILSPNMDRLAAEGTSFRRAYCAAPLCNPSRTALLTGIATRQNGIYTNRNYFRNSTKPYVREAITLPQFLRQQGLYTAGTGKIFHFSNAQKGPFDTAVTDWPDTRNSWDVWVNGEGDGMDHGNATLSPWSTDDALFRFGTTDTPTASMDDYQKADLIGRVLTEGRVTTKDGAATRTFDLPSDRPFFLACGIFRPHLPFIVPPEFVTRFKSEDIAITRDYYQQTVEDTKDLPPGAFDFIERPRDDGEPGTGRFSDMLRQGKHRDPHDGDLKAWREMIRHYLASVSFADKCVGRLLTALDHSRWRANTVVVLWSDHGWDLGTKFRAGKVALWESTTNCVLIVRDPATPADARGVPCYADVSLQDLYPTICARLGIKPPAYVAGRDLGPLLQNPRQPWDEIPITTQGARNHALRGENIRYIRYDDTSGNAELYDERADPREHTNAIAAPTLQSARQQFESMLDAELAKGPFPYDGRERRPSFSTPATKPD